MLFRPITFGGLLNNISDRGLLFFRSRAMSAIPRDHGDRRAARATALCLRPSARYPTPHAPLLKTKAEVPFDRPVDRTVEAIFSCLSAVQSGPISALFSRFCCPVGRGSQRIMVCILVDC
jgi:hypothetical protein